MDNGSDLQGWSIRQVADTNTGATNKHPPTTELKLFTQTTRVVVEAQLRTPQSVSHSLCSTQRRSEHHQGRCVLDSVWIGWLHRIRDLECVLVGLDERRVDDDERDTTEHEACETKNNLVGVQALHELSDELQGGGTHTRVNFMHAHQTMCAQVHKLKHSAHLVCSIQVLVNLLDSVLNPANLLSLPNNLVCSVSRDLRKSNGDNADDQESLRMGSEQPATGLPPPSRSLCGGHPGDGPWFDH